MSPSPRRSKTTTGTLHEEENGTTTPRSSDSDDDGSYVTDEEEYTGESDEEESDEDEDEEDDDDVSHLVPVVDRTKKTPSPQRTLEQQEQQRRIIGNLAASACSRSSEEDDNADSFTSDDKSNDDEGDGRGDYPGPYQQSPDVGATMSTTGGYVGGESSSVGTHSTTATNNKSQPPGHAAEANPTNHRSKESPQSPPVTSSVVSTDSVHERSVSTNCTTPRTGQFRRSNKPQPHLQQPHHRSPAALAAAAVGAPPLSPRDRIPGGAMAKLMLLGPKGSKESEESGSIVGQVEHSSSTESSSKISPDDLNKKMGEELKRIKEEYTEGSPNRRKRSTNDNNSCSGSEANTNVSNTPSFLNRSEIFHRTAAAAVAALLGKPARPSSSNHATPTIPTETNAFSPFTPSFTTRNPSKAPESTAAPTLPPTSTEAMSPTLLSKETEKKLENIESKMVRPTLTLTDLLTAVASPEEQKVTLGYAVRRKNACGALQTLTTDPTNRVRICWTAGVLVALKTVLVDGLDADVMKMMDQDDARIRTEYEAARIRAISALMNLSMPVKNRIAVFHSPGLVHAVLQTIEQDHGQARRGCCAILALLAKSSENRLLLAQVPGLVDAVRKVLKPRPPRVEPAVTGHHAEAKKMYPWSDGDETLSSSNSSHSPHHNDDDNNKNSSSSSPSKKNNNKNINKKSKGNNKKNKIKKVVSSSSVVIDEHSYDDSDETPKVEGASSPRELTGYDDTADEMLQGARQNIFAMLGHLVKEKDNAYFFARVPNFLSIMVEISQHQESPSHALAVKILAHLTRHRLNKVLAFKPKSVVPAFVEATQSPNDEARLYACYGLQNLSQEKSCRQELAITERLMETLCDRCRSGVNADERLAAISTLKNLCDEPANLIPMTNTTGCVSTLMHLAHAAPDSDVTELMQYRACDALATLSHWLRKIATTGHLLEANRNKQQGPRPTTKGLLVPSLREVSWNQWT